MSALNILHNIYNILHSDNEVDKLIGNDIYIQIAEENTTFPFVVLKRENLQTDYVKNNVAVDNVDISVNIAATTYRESIDIAEAVRNVLVNYSDTNIQQCRMISATEDFAENTYIQQLNFSLKYFY